LLDDEPCCFRDCLHMCVTVCVNRLCWRIWF
jgi:hypothetical protein